MALALAPALAQTRAPSATAERLPSACTRPDWPPEARRYDLEGTTVLDYRIREWRIADVKVRKSSGWPILDAAAARGLQACKLKADPDRPRDSAVRSVDYVWATAGGPSARPQLHSGSCVASPLFSGFVPLDRTPTARDGVLVRFLTNGRGEPFNIRLEGRVTDTALAEHLRHYVQTCRFVAANAPGAKTDAVYGRVLLATPPGAE
ncbi:energy transducer TonB [Massilia pseudoviolaceinigra]|uniref:energy transducer TonB n=1 Tax=Massilia pseudoviolaceinigra TaxID=3057165 RepID=UPI002796B6FC|nr:energy transducer TonB [Massilia sp. CCM 9206]MDQ1920315.1 energy transducer TonB [Massilia sp. CCM 9206]